MYKFCFFVPVSDLECVKQAVFDAGAGKIGQYIPVVGRQKDRGSFDH